MARIDAVIFDFDGVIADSEPAHFRALARALADRGVALDFDAYRRHYLGYGDADLLRQLSADRSLPWRDADLEDVMHRKNAIFDASADEAEVLMPFALICAQRLHAAGVRMAIASGARTVEISRLLSAAGAAALFPVIVGADDVSAGKPDPQPYLLAARRLGMDAARCAAVEDSPWGLASAHAAGCRTIAVTNTYPRSELTADVIIDSLDELTPRALEMLSS